MLRNSLLSFLFIATASANTLNLISGDGQLVEANTGQHGNPITFQVVNGATPVPGATITFSSPNGFALPLTATAVTTDGNGNASVSFAPGNIQGISELFTINATSPGANTVVFHETAALVPPTATSLNHPPPLIPYTANAQVAGPAISISVFGEVPLPYVSLSLYPIPVSGVSPPPGTIFESVSCLVGGVLTSQVLTDSAGNATCIPVFSEPNQALNFKYNTGQFRVLIGEFLGFGPFPYNILPSPPVITGGPKSQLFLVNSAVNAQITLSGGTAPFTFTLAQGSGPLPPGVTLGSNGQITGSATAPGLYPFVAQVTDSLGKTATSANLNLSIAISGGQFTTTPAALPEGVVNLPYSQTITINGGVPPYMLSVGGTLPPGIVPTFGAGAAAGTVTFAGTPTATGTFQFSILGTDSVSSPLQVSLPVLIVAKLTVPGAQLPPASVGTPYTFQLTPTAGVGPYMFSSSNAPAGLTVSPTGVLSGTPTITGLNSFAITVTDAYQETVTSELILPVSGGTLTITPTLTLPPATAGSAYSQQISAPSGGVPNYSFKLTGTIPSGISLTTSGILSGTFAAAGPVTLSYQVTDAIGTSVTGALLINVAAAVPIIGAVTNAGSSLAGPVSPGEIVSIYGVGLGPVTGVAAPVTNDAFPLSASGVQVLFGTTPAPLLYLSATQINAIVPFEIVPGTEVPVTVVYNGATSDAQQVMTQATAPGIFVIGPTQGAILNADYSLNGATNGAAVGSFIQIYATGGGQTTPAVLDGTLAAGASTASIPDVAVTIGGVTEQVLYAGAAPGLVGGVLQINVLLEAGTPSGTAEPVILSIGGQASLQTITVSIK